MCRCGAFLAGVWSRGPPSPFASLLPHLSRSKSVKRRPSRKAETPFLDLWRGREVVNARRGRLTLPRVVPGCLRGHHPPLCDTPLSLSVHGKCSGLAAHK